MTNTSIVKPVDILYQEGRMVFRRTDLVRNSVMVKAAVSLLCAKEPFQFEMKDKDIEKILESYNENFIGAFIVEGKKQICFHPNNKKQNLISLNIRYTSREHSYWPQIDLERS